MSLTAIDLHGNGRIGPLKENPAIKRLRNGEQHHAINLLQQLVQDDDDVWQARDDAEELGSRKRREFKFGFQITRYRNTWYAVRREEGAEVLGYVSFGPTPLTESTYDLYWIAVDKSKHRAGVGNGDLEQPAAAERGVE